MNRTPVPFVSPQGYCPAMVGTGPLIGRERELATLHEMLVSTQLLTITGTGGCGKTRVAIELAGRVGSESEELETHVVELSFVTTAEQAVSAVLRGIGGRERGAQAPIDGLVERLANRRLLLVLDNCEHLTVAVRRLADRLLATASELRLLVTSREPLRLPYEAVFRLMSLSMPDGEGDVAAVVRSDAGRLFVDRAAAANPAFSLTPPIARSVVRICCELDGLPLALVLAAARVNTMSPNHIADGLSRRGRLVGAPDERTPQRHRSLRASLDWSYQLLDGEERSLLRRLSTFSGGWTSDAAQAVALPHANETSVCELLDALEAKGLILPMPSRREQRWTILQTVGEFAAEQLAQEGEQSDVEHRHVEWFRRYAANADRQLIDWHSHELINEETANLHLALRRAISHDPDSAVAIAASLIRHWILGEHFEEARAAVTAVLSLETDDTDGEGLALLHSGTAAICMLSEDYPKAVAHAQAGLALAAEVDDVDAQACCLQLSGLVQILTGVDLQAGWRHTNQAVDLLRSSDDRLGLAWALVNLAMAAGVCDRFDAVRTAYSEFLTIKGACEHRRLRTWAEQAAAWAEVMVGSPERALAHVERSIELEGDWPSMTYFQGVSHRLHALARLGRVDEALEGGARAMAGAVESGACHAVPSLELGLAVAELVGGNLDAAERRARGLLEKMPQLHTIALMREVLAHASLARGDSDEARAQGSELALVAERTGSARHRAVAKFVLGCAAGIDGCQGAGRELLQEALAAYAELGLERGAADVLDELALLAAGCRDAPRAARLAGAAAAARERLSCVPLTSTAHRLKAARASVVGRDGLASWEEAWNAGQALPLADAIAYARRGRGPRDRPPAGWESLTSAELEVAQRASVGMSNPEIASQLFMSRSTVKMHLSSVYLKLGVANRTNLARAIAVRDADGSSTERRRAAWTIAISPKSQDQSRATEAERLATWP